MIGSARFSNTSDLTGTGRLGSNFVYDATGGPLQRLSAPAYGYDAMPKLVPSYSAPMAKCAPNRNSDTPGTCGTLPATSPGVWDTSNQNDAETGLDYFGARYYS